MTLKEYFWFITPNGTLRAAESRRILDNVRKEYEAGESGSGPESERLAQKMLVAPVKLPDIPGSRMTVLCDWDPEYKPCPKYDYPELPYFSENGVASYLMIMQASSDGEVLLSSKTQARHVLKYITEYGQSPVFGMVKSVPIQIKA